MATHKQILSVRVDSDLFDEVRAMLLEEHQGTRPQRSNNKVPYGTLYTLIDNVLREWLETQKAQKRNRDHAKEFAHGDRL